jgi:hypothetical protein
LIEHAGFRCSTPPDTNITSETSKMFGKLLLTVDAVALLLGAPIADYNHTHIFNPRWPPHAKYV